MLLKQKYHGLGSALQGASMVGFSLLPLTMQPLLSTSCHPPVLENNLEGSGRFDSQQGRRRATEPGHSLPETPWSSSRSALWFPGPRMVHAAAQGHGAARRSQPLMTILTLRQDCPRPAFLIKAPPCQISTLHQQPPSMFFPGLSLLVY